MENACVGCRKPNIDSQCEVCSGGVCRKCRVLLSEGEFPFAPDRAAELKHSCYCGACYGEKVEPFKAEYDELLEKARQINIIFKNSKSTVRILRKAKQAVHINDQIDRDEALLYLGFQSARAGYNAVIDVETAHKKVRHEGYQKTAWTAQGLFADISSHGLDNE